MWDGGWQAYGIRSLYWREDCAEAMEEGRSGEWGTKHAHCGELVRINWLVS